MSETDAAAVGAAECVPALPPDVVAEILARVPPDVAFLFRCAIVCKQWCRLLTDAAFLRRLLPESGRSSLLGFIAKRTETTMLLPARAPAFLPAPGSALGPGDRSLASFVRDDAGVLDQAEPLAAHDGLLLLRVPPRSTDDKDLRLAVCNLLTGRLDVLPPLSTALFDGEGVRGYAVATAADHGSAAAPRRPADGYSTFFQVLLIAVHLSDNQVFLHRFSSSAADASSNWRITPTNCFRQPGRNWRAALNNYLCRDWNCFRRKQGHLSQGCRAATVCYGTAHWLFQWGGSLYVHRVSVNTGQFCTTKIPIDVFYWFNARLCLSVDARLSLAYVHEDYLRSWTQRDGDPDYKFGWRQDQISRST